MDSEPPVTLLTKAILLDGVKRGARTIELRDTGFAVRLMYFAEGVWIEGMTIPDQLHAPVVEILAGFAAINPQRRSRGTFDLIIGAAKIRYHFELELRGPTTFQVSVRKVSLAN
jgi:hypothetical protein